MIDTGKGESGILRYIHRETGPEAEATDVDWLHDDALLSSDLDDLSSDNKMSTPKKPKIC